MSESAKSTFYLQQLGYFPHLFSDEERDALVKWGAHAAGLTDGSIKPASGKEIQFVDAAKAKKPPTTRFQRVWLRYLQAVDMQTSWRDCEKKLAATAAQLSAANSKIERLEAEVLTFNKRTGLAKYKSVEEKQGSNTRPDIAESVAKHDIEIQNIPLAPGNASPERVLQPTVFASNVTNREQYLQLTKNGLGRLSDNDIFTLFNIVDGINLTSQELADFSREHQNRKQGYSPEGGYGNTRFVEYAKTDGQ